LVPVEIIPCPTVEQQQNQLDPNFGLLLNLPPIPSDLDILQEVEDHDIMTFPGEVFILKNFFNEFFV